VPGGEKLVLPAAQAIEVASTKARVLPVPVWAAARTSRPGGRVDGGGLDGG